MARSRGASVPVMRGSGTLVWVRRKPVAAVARYTTNNRARMAPTIIISRRGCRRIGAFPCLRGARGTPFVVEEKEKARGPFHTAPVASRFSGAVVRGLLQASRHHAVEDDARRQAEPRGERSRRVRLRKARLQSFRGAVMSDRLTMQDPRNQYPRPPFPRQPQPA